MRTPARAAALLGVGLVLARMVAAQSSAPGDFSQWGPKPGVVAQGPAVLDGDRRTQIRTLIIEAPLVAQSQHPVPPLSAAGEAELQRARGFRQLGLYDRARTVLTELLAQNPHHPVVLAELASVYGEQQNWLAIATLGRAERGAAHDSLLLGHELADALEQLKRYRDAAQVTLEVWLVSPGEMEWARPSLARLAGLEPTGVREVVRRAAERRPERMDLLRTAAQLDFRLGDPEAALKLLHSVQGKPGAALRLTFADELLRTGVLRDSLGAVAALVDLAGDDRAGPPERLFAAKRAWLVHTRRGTTVTGARDLSQALHGVPAERWDRELLLAVSRALREGGNTQEARTLIGGLGSEQSSSPDVALERALNELREGPPEKALPALAALAEQSPEAGFRFAEARFFAGLPDSALSSYQRIAQDPAGPFTGAALERIYLLEDGQPRTALPLFGRLAYERWRGETRRALGIADSLYHSLPHEPLWALAALELSSLRDASGDAKAALEPLMAVAESLPDDRLAPSARQRAGDLYRLRLKDDAKALEQYEECLARYPKAWNAPEVRRLVEAMRRERRF